MIDKFVVKVWILYSRDASNVNCNTKIFYHCLFFMNAGKIGTNRKGKPSSANLQRKAAIVLLLQLKEMELDICQGLLRRLLRSGRTKFYRENDYSWDEFFAHHYFVKILKLIRFYCLLCESNTCNS